MLKKYNLNNNLYQHYHYLVLNFYLIFFPKKKSYLQIIILRISRVSHRWNCLFYTLKSFYSFFLTMQLRIREITNVQSARREKGRLMIHTQKKTISKWEFKVQLWAIKIRWMWNVIHELVYVLIKRLLMLRKMITHLFLAEQSETRKNTQREACKGSQKKDHKKCKFLWS